VKPWGGAGSLTLAAQEGEPDEHQTFPDDRRDTGHDNPLSGRLTLALIPESRNLRSRPRAPPAQNRRLQRMPERGILYPVSVRILGHLRRFDMKGKLWGLGLAALLLTAPFARCARLYSDSINGSVQACKTKSYSEIGNATHGFTLTRTAMDSCKSGAAKSTATVHVGPPGGSGSVTSATTMGEDIASASMNATDVVHLTPPAGFTGTMVPVIFRNTYQFNITGVSGPASGQYTICWNIEAEQCMTSSNNGMGTQTYHVAFQVTKTAESVVPDAGSGFQFQVQVSGMSEATNGATASISTGNVVIDLPAGWKYRWASKP
jgi:hypothetical protein